MTVIVQAQVRKRVWGGELGPQYPIATWHRTIAVVGDGSGGRREVDFVFQPSTAPTLDGNIYSLEQLSMTDTDNTSVFATLQTFGMGEVNGEQGWNIGLVAGVSPGFAAIAMRDVEALRGLMLGEQQVQGTTSLLAVYTLEQLNETIRVHAEGYIWGSRSRSTVGGPKRPLESPYGS